MTEFYRTEIVIPAPPELVFGYFVDPELLPRWLGVSARLDPRPGGEFRFEVATDEWCSGTYLVVDPPSRVAFTWGWESGRIDLPPGSSTVEVELEAIPEGTYLTLTHRGLEGEILAIHADGWPRYVERLSAVVTGRAPGPDPAERTPEEVFEDLGGTTP